ncbi:hypothetical protein DPMN_037636 [Dreissena polymorpha]|uniref:Uncharacterized protein n=1 Tax=Dreissena polymorpha TaxID=45954 RepID=A0A9D4RN04_DREPO|nr:hypothetical protein DPMN_037636 [Dreissena polymorpha]
MKVRNKSERFAKSKKKQTPIDNVVFDNKYSFTELCDGDLSENDSSKSYSHLLNGVQMSKQKWVGEWKKID